MRIALNSTAEAEIVVADGAAQAERHAADELARFLGEVTGGQFRVGGAVRSGTPRILVGAAAARLADPAFDAAGLGDEGFAIRTAGADLILAGATPRGTLYAVYTFLETHVGCRWWSSKASSIPNRPTIKIGPLDIREKPTLEYREAYWMDAFDPDWAARNKLNGSHHRLDARRGGKHVFAGWAHTFYRLLPPEEYFAAHPDWYSEVKGQRTHERAQLCLTNAEMTRELVRRLKEKIRSTPDATLAFVSQNDWDGHCECPRCAAVDDEEGSPAGTLIRFVNEVAAAIEPEFPHIGICTLAYCYTQRPPRLVHPRSNVIVWLCTIHCSFSTPISTQKERTFLEDIEGWSRICARLYIWDYVTNFHHYLMPYPNLRVLGPNLRYFVEHNVKGVFEQGAGETQAEMEELRAWVLAKLLWNPALDAQALIDEFVHGYYEAAAPHVLAYLNAMHDSAAATGAWVGCYSRHTSRFLTIGALLEGWEHLRRAEDEVSGVRVQGSVRTDGRHGSPRAASGGRPSIPADKAFPLSSGGSGLPLCEVSEGCLRYVARAVPTVPVPPEPRTLNPVLLPLSPALLFRIRMVQLSVLYIVLMRWDELRAAAAQAGLAWPWSDEPARLFEDFKTVASAGGVNRLREHYEGFEPLVEALKVAGAKA